jgi:hypothetical protein
MNRFSASSIAELSPVRLASIAATEGLVFEDE